MSSLLIKSKKKTQKINEITETFVQACKIQYAACIEFTNLQA
jgi:hypothetical protein